ncbi:YidC/Oxa1 family membrane protein insertase [Olsenella porci]|jgi:YidC/Oxa1 family membrane protein insertase|uniref:Membrane protein insertase YidC n=1 Tax=Olsenella porci TaxID=2652279 RepID=A0A6N7XNY5_9ACTN|nr:YidC/Oxa1 family membrane protein insertase [Olsenella porci]MST71649.1 YidC/Oxa1 family membrane protein insertase [Olsenella porci]
MWDWFINFLTGILAQLAALTGDWGLAVIVITFIMRLIVMPLQTRSTQSSARMQALQPQLMEIQQRYANDPERQADEMRKFYAENKFNPLGGCLPLLIQMPVFFALFAVMKKVPETAHFLNIMPSLSQSASGAWAAGGFSGALVYILFDIAFGVMTFIPMVMNLQNTTEDQRQQTLIMGVVMSIMMLWFGWTCPGAVLLYYVTSALWQTIQQKVVTQRVMDKVKAETEEKLKSQPVQVDVVRKEHKPRPKKKH